MCAERLPRPVSTISEAMKGRWGEPIRKTSAPWAASARPQTGPAMMRVRSSTRTRLSGRAAGSNSLIGARPMRSTETRGCPASAAPWGEASHSAGLRIMVATRPRAATASSKASACQPSSATCTDSRV